MMEQRAFQVALDPYRSLRGRDRGMRRASVRLSMGRRRCRPFEARLNDAARGGELMFRVARPWLFIVAGLLASPVPAQQTAPDQSPPQSQEQPAPAVPSAGQPTQTCPDGSVIPAGASCPAPPPFPPMPARAPHHRWVDVGTGGGHAHHGHHAVQHRALHRRHAARPRHETRHLSKRAIRFCHGLTHRQMLRHSTCRALAQHQHKAVRHRHHVVHRHVTRHRHSRRHRT
jgi:hypothetical protein